MVKKAPGIFRGNFREKTFTETLLCFPDQVKEAALRQGEKAARDLGAPSREKPGLPGLPGIPGPPKR
jgi:hypothetical protein